MYLYEVYVNNGLEYGDESNFTKLVVAKNENEAEEKVKQTKDYEWHETHNTWFQTEKVETIDGYKVKLEKINIEIGTKAIAKQGYHSFEIGEEIEFIGMVENISYSQEDVKLYDFKNKEGIAQHLKKEEFEWVE